MLNSLSRYAPHLLAVLRIVTALMGDAAVLFCFVFLYLVAAGPGAWSVDNRNA